MKETKEEQKMEKKMTYEEAVRYLQSNYKYARCSAIIDSSSNILYSTDNWDISNDVKNIIAAWRSGSPRFVKISSLEMNFSVLQTGPVRFISTNFDQKGHLIGACTPDQFYYMVSFIAPEAYDWAGSAFPNIARAVAMLVGVPYYYGKFRWIKDGHNKLNYLYGSIHYEENGIEKHIYISLFHADTRKTMSKLHIQNEDVIEFSIQSIKHAITWYGSKRIQTIYDVKIIKRTINREKPTRDELSNPHRHRYIYKFNEEINQFEELVFIGEINRNDLLDSTSVFLIINFISLNAWFDLQGLNVWLWYGSEISDTTKSKSEKIATEFLELITPIEIFIIQENNEPYTFSYAVGHEIYTDPKLEEINAKYDTFYIKILSGHLSVFPKQTEIQEEFFRKLSSENYRNQLDEREKIRKKEKDQILNDQDLKQWINKNKDILKYAEIFPKPKRIGFWKTGTSSEIEQYMDEEWSKTEQRDIVLFYLRSGRVTSENNCISFCRVCHKMNGGDEVNSIDNKWYYPDGYPHYIASHMVKPPKELISDALEWFEENKLKIKRIM